MTLPPPPPLCTNQHTVSVNVSSNPIRVYVGIMKPNWILVAFLYIAIYKITYAEISSSASIGRHSKRIGAC